MRPRDHLEGFNRDVVAAFGGLRPKINHQRRCLWRRRAVPRRVRRAFVGSGAGLATGALEVSCAGSEPDLMAASTFSSPIASGSLYSDENVKDQGISITQEQFPDKEAYPSRVPRTSGFFLRDRFDCRADASPDGRFTP